jgi:site-specific recombinase XerD
MTKIEAKKRPRIGPSPRSLLLSEWPEADRAAWQDACRPSVRLKPGGSASYLAEVSREDFARRYGAFLGFLQRKQKLDLQAAAGTQVTPLNVEQYITELKERVSTVTVWNCIYKLRRASELLDPKADCLWLLEIERDLALVMEPKSKFDRLVFTRRLVEAGLTLVVEAQEFAKSDYARAKRIRNGLMIALLGICPIRIKNFAALEIGATFKEVNGSWWIAVSKSSTKTGNIEERRIPDRLNRAIDIYMKQSRPVLMKSGMAPNWLWISSKTGSRFTTKNLGTLISKITLRTLGVDVSPHLFRTAGATTSVTYASDTPHLASGVLGHRDPRVTQEHYIRATSVNAAQTYAEIVRQYRATDS